MPILTEWELWACANEYIRQHGSDASLQAASRAEELLKKGDPDGAQNWRLIANRAADLLAGSKGTPQ